jgi:chromosome segregation ATPase
MTQLEKDLEKAKQMFEELQNEKIPKMVDDTVTYYEVAMEEAQQRCTQRMFDYREHLSRIEYRNATVNAQKESIEEEIVALMKAAETLNEMLTNIQSEARSRLNRVSNEIENVVAKCKDKMADVVGEDGEPKQKDITANLTSNSLQSEIQSSLRELKMTIRNLSRANSRIQESALKDVNEIRAATRGGNALGPRMESINKNVTWLVQSIQEQDSQRSQICARGFDVQTLYDRLGNLEQRIGMLNTRLQHNTIATNPHYSKPSSPKISPISTSPLGSPTNTTHPPQSGTPPNTPPDASLATLPSVHTTTPPQTPFTEEEAQPPSSPPKEETAPVREEENTEAA